MLCVATYIHYNQSLIFANEFNQSKVALFRITSGIGLLFQYGYPIYLGKV